MKCSWRWLWGKSSSLPGSLKVGGWHVDLLAHQKPLFTTAVPPRTPDDQRPPVVPNNSTLPTLTHILAFPPLQPLMLTGSSAVRAFLSSVLSKPSLFSPLPYFCSRWSKITPLLTFSPLTARVRVGGVHL